MCPPSRFRFMDACLDSLQRVKLSDPSVIHAIAGGSLSNKYPDKAN